MLERYLRLPRSVVLLVLAQLLIHLVNGSMILILNIYLSTQGFDDEFIGEASSFRYLGSLALALPLGIWIRDKPLKGVLLAACALIPIASWGVVSAAQARDAFALEAALAIWGIGMTAVQVPSLPLLLRICAEEERAEALSLVYSTWWISLVGCGVLFPLISGSLGDQPEATYLRIAAGTALLAIPLVAGIREQRPAAPPRRGNRILQEYDWRRVLAAEAPNVVIAVGAGLTIQFVSLFFHSVFDLDTASFSALGGATGVLVIAAALVNPTILRRLGYRAAILGTQSLAVGFLVLLALSELLRGWSGAFPLAVTCYLLRQPLMNMAGPITSELALGYVGTRNRELVSALSASVWSGSWFLSAQIFRLLRAASIPYWQIFLITATLYSVGISLYWRLIVLDERSARPT